MNCIRARSVEFAPSAALNSLSINWHLPTWTPSGFFGLTQLNRLREHLYIPVKKKNRKQIEADAVPNRHAAIHGLVVYRTAKNYTLRI